MAEHHHAPGTTAPVERRVDAIQSVLEERGMKPAEFIEQANHLVEEQWVPRNGARVVARAWTDAAFKQRLFANGREAVSELGLSMPPHHRHLVTLENTATVHNVICCTLCSCTAFTIIGLPPDWYKDLEYRARAVRESRTVLREMGLALPPEVEIAPARPLGPLQGAQGFPPPRLIDVHRQDVIEQVIARRDVRKHLLHVLALPFPTGGLFGATGGFSAFGGLVGRRDDWHWRNIDRRGSTSKRTPVLGYAIRCRLSTSWDLSPMPMSFA